MSAAQGMAAAQAAAQASVASLLYKQACDPEIVFEGFVKVHHTNEFLKERLGGAPVDYAFDVDSKRLTLCGANKRRVVVHAELLGTQSFVSNTFRWLWHNDDLTDDVVAMSLEVKAAGDQDGIEEFSLSQFQFDSHAEGLLTRQTLGTVLVGLLADYEAKGYYFGSYGTGGFFYLLFDTMIPEASPHFTPAGFVGIMRSFLSVMPGSLAVPFAKECARTLELFVEDNIATFYANGSAPFIKLHFSPSRVVALALNRHLQIIAVSLELSESVYPDGEGEWSDTDEDMSMASLASDRRSFVTVAPTIYEDLAESPEDEVELMGVHSVAALDLASMVGEQGRASCSSLTLPPNPQHHHHHDGASSDGWETMDEGEESGGSAASITTGTQHGWEAEADPGFCGRSEFSDIAEESDAASTVAPSSEAGVAREQQQQPLEEVVVEAVAGSVAGVEPVLAAGPGPEHQRLERQSEAERDPEREPGQRAEQLPPPGEDSDSDDSTPFSPPPPPPSETRGLPPTSPNPVPIAKSRTTLLGTMVAQFARSTSTEANIRPRAESMLAALGRPRRGSGPGPALTKLEEGDADSPAPRRKSSIAVEV